MIAIVMVINDETGEVVLPQQAFKENSVEESDGVLKYKFEFEVSKQLNIPQPSQAQVIEEVPNADNG